MALNQNVHQAIERHLRNVTLIKYNGESIGNDGEATDTTPTSSTIQLALLPISGKELQTLPEGVYDKFDRKAYSLDIGSVIPNESIINSDFGKFKILSTDDRYYEGGFVVYYTKKVIEL